jgi:hypothetical protein
MNRAVRALRVLALAGLAVGICVSCGGKSGGNGDGDGGNGINDVDPVVIPGGGVGSGAIRGELNVHVVYVEGDQPIAGANVQVGEPDDSEPLTGVTDSNGLVVFTGSGLDGPQTVTVTASGYGAATWFGVNGANVTVAIGRYPATPVPTAHVSGTIEDWNSIPDPAFGHYTAALINYSHTDRLLGPENSIEQPTDGNNVPLNLCVHSPPISPDPCNWELTTRTGRQIIYAAILDGNANGTPTNPDDDTFQLIGYAVAMDQELTAGQNLANLVLTRIPSANLTDVTVSFPASLAGLDNVLGLPYLVMGEQGRAPFYIFTPNTLTAPLPALTGTFATGSYDFGALANPGNDITVPTTASFLRDVDISATVQFPAWLPLPTGLSEASGVYEFTPADGADLHSVVFQDTAGDAAWTAVLLDGRTSFSLPSLTPDPMAVTALVLPGFDPMDFSSADHADTVTQTSVDSITFTH